MSMYDTFIGQCPKCALDFDIQTKAFGRDMSNFKIGASVGDYMGVTIFSGTLQLKWPCHACEGIIIAVIENNFLLGYTTDVKPDVVETLWGGIFNSVEEAEAAREAMTGAINRMIEEARENEQSSQA